MKITISLLTFSLHFETVSFAAMWRYNKFISSNHVRSSNQFMLNRILSASLFVFDAMNVIFIQANDTRGQLLRKI